MQGTYPTEGSMNGEKMVRMDNRDGYGPVSHLTKS